MFIRKTTQYNKGKKYFQHKLVKSIRTANGPRQIIILNLGSFKLDKDKWKDLANCIESKITGQTDFLNIYDYKIERLAEHYATLIKNKEQRKTEEIEEKNNIEEQADYEKININSCTTTKARSIGIEHIAVSQLKEYNLNKLLKTLKFTEKESYYSQILITSRMLHPASERETARWVNENSSIKEFFNSGIKVYDNALHRAAIKLYENKDRIELALSASAKNKFNLKETILLYDLTNTYFESNKKNSTIAKYGRSKEKRKDCPIVTLALTVDEDGFPKQSKILEGNISEVDTLENMLKEISTLNNQDKTIVIDAGIASEKNIEIINRYGFKYIAVSRKKHDYNIFNNSEEKEIDLNNDNAVLKVKLAKIEQEAYLLCYSQDKEHKERAILKRKLLGFEKELNNINQKLTQKGTEKKYDKIIERIGRIKQRYKVGTLYDINIEKKDKNAVKITYKKNSKAINKQKTIGKYILRTNRLDLDEYQISKIHRSLSIVEDSFKTMKSDLGMRPNYHKNDNSMIAHIFISVLGFHMIRAIIKKLKNNKINYSWKSIINILTSHQRITTSFVNDKNELINIRDNTIPTLEQAKIYNSLAIKKNPLKKIKTKLKKIANVVLKKKMCLL